MDNCSRTLKSRLKKDDECIYEKIICILLCLIYLIEKEDCCKYIDGGTFSTN